MGTIYLVFFIMIIFTIFIMIMVIAGKDILMAFRRKMIPTGCDVFMANSNRNMSHYYMKPKEGKFVIDKLPYVTNPEKTMHFAEVDKLKILDALLKKETRIKDKIKDFQQKKEEVDALIKTTKQDSIKFQLQSQSKHFEKIIEETRALLETKQESYYNQRRAAYFFIEGDPIPKDFYEYYSSVDNKILDNVVSRSITQPQEIAKQQQTIDALKKLIWFAVIAGAIAALLAFSNSNMLTQLCQSAGLECKLV